MQTLLLRRSLLLPSLVLLLCLPAMGRGRVAGWCEEGGQKVTTLGYQSSAATPIQRSYTTCTVTVFLTGTSTLAALYADNASTPLANPFTLGVSPETSGNGYWFFYADDGRYDIQFSGGGIPSPFKLADVGLNTGGIGSGITVLSGDGSAVGPGAATFILSTVNSNVGGCGDSTHVCQVTVNAKGLITSAVPVTITGGGGASIPPTTNIIKGNGLGNGADTKVAVTSPTTAGTLAFPVDNATVAFQGTDTYVGRATTDTLTNKTFDTAGAGNSFRIAGTGITAVSGTGGTVCLTVGSTCSGAAIGGGVTSATDKSVLFAHPGATLAQDNVNFNYDQSIRTLNIANLFNQDPTAVTGITENTTKQGANQCTGGGIHALWHFTESTGFDGGTVDCVGDIAVYDGLVTARKKAALAGPACGVLSNCVGALGGAIALSSDSGVCWRSVNNIDAAGSWDTGFERVGAGIVKVSDCSGTLKTLSAVSLQTGASPPAVTGNSIIGLAETTGQGCVAAADCIIADSATHKLLGSYNNDTPSPFCRVSDGCGGGSVSAGGPAMYPFGTMSNSAIAAYSANSVHYYPLTIPPGGYVVSAMNIVMWTSDPGEHLSVSIYDSTCTKVTNGQSTTVTTPGGFDIASVTWSTPPTLAPVGGSDFGWVGISADGAAVIASGNLDGINGRAGELLNSGLGSTTYLLFTGANAASGTTTHTQPSTCGSRTAIGSGGSQSLPSFGIR